MAEFAGFPKETPLFLAGVRDNNTKTWFDAHRSDYEAFWLEPAKSFVEAMGDALAEIVPGIVAEPKVNGSIRRINRDTRFSKDETPYKDHLDIGFWKGDRKNMLSGFWMRVGPETIGVGVGAHGFDKDRLPRYRDAVTSRESSESLAHAVAAVEILGHSVHGEHYKRVPPGYEPANEFQERFVRFAGLYTGWDEPHPEAMHSDAIVGWLLERWEPQLPLHRWLVDVLG